MKRAWLETEYYYQVHQQRQQIFVCVKTLAMRRRSTDRSGIEIEDSVFELGVCESWKTLFREYGHDTIQKYWRSEGQKRNNFNRSF